MKAGRQEWLPRVVVYVPLQPKEWKELTDNRKKEQTPEIYIQRGDDWLTDRATHADMRLIYSQWFRSLWVGVLELIDFLPSQNMKEASQTNPHVGLPQN